MTSAAAPPPRSWLAFLLVGALGFLDLLTGLGMLLAPESFSAQSGLPVGVPSITQGYGQRIALLGGVYLTLAWRLYRRNIRARRWLILPLVDETWNTLLDIQLLVTGGLPAAALQPMIALHAFFALGLGVTVAVGRRGKAVEAPVAGGLRK